ncbi:MAG TPA: 16S rRNA (cytosine(967)-C(5))-methyltransferase RsmB [Solirubrobacteraceae bacterium]|nr:16S rRNA (cytosine(967)-C(5))-methyltransferase RsmB [Solirubrobacteraceae bacterium]
MTRPVDRTPPQADLRADPPTDPRSAVAPARACAYAVLRRVFEEGAYADKALQGQARGLDARDRALARRLAYGAVQRKGTLDHLIGRLAERPSERLDGHVLAALRLGLYELLYTRGAPDHAVVADAVELAKGSGRAGHGLVNAVLRRGAREGAELLDAFHDRTPQDAAVKHSHPEWIARLWWEQLGADDARALMARDNEPGEQALRANTLVTDAPTLARALASGDPAQGARPVRTRPDPDIPEALVLEDPFDAHGSKLWREGAFLAQSRAAMLVARALDPQPGERVLDLCAAPGGKSTHLAALMRGTGEVVAVERDRRRAGALARAAQRLRAGNVRVELADAALGRPEGAAFDRVLVDPPCSGLGTLQARPDLRWRMEPSRMGELERTQAKILAAAAEAVRPGGVLVYSTCTISATENELQIAAFLDASPRFELDDLRVELPAYSNPHAPETVLTLPHRDRTAGFFIARLRRKG